MSTENTIAATSSMPMLFIAIGAVVAIYWIFIRPKKNNDSQALQESQDTNLQNTNNEQIKTNRRLSPQELLDKAWAFLNVIAEKVLQMNFKTQKDILAIGRKMKKSGMVFTVMVDDGNSSPPRSPAKEKAAQEQGKGNSSQPSQ